jgi:hypothetical protein
MLSENTLSKLNDMKLSVMAKTFLAQISDNNINEFSF